LDGGWHVGSGTCLTLPFGCPDLTTFCRLNELGLMKSGSSRGSANDTTETGN
jgi:hypothetical protein